jgi:hypothetical protein
MTSTENLERIVRDLENLPDKYETEHSLKQNGYVEGVCDSINIVVKLFIHNVSNSVVCGNCDGWGYTVDENGRRKEHCKECE